MKYFFEIPLPRFAVEEEGGEGELEVFGVALEGQIDRQESSAGASLQKTPKIIFFKKIWGNCFCAVFLFSHLTAPSGFFQPRGATPTTRTTGSEFRPLRGRVS